MSNVAKYGIVPRDMQDLGETPSQAYGKFCWGPGAAKWALCHVHLASGTGNNTQVCRKA